MASECFEIGAQIRRGTCPELVPTPGMGSSPVRCYLDANHAGKCSIDRCLKLEPGKFYRARNGYVWCCYRVRPGAEKQARASCIQVEDAREEYFYEDGCYDTKGDREHTLVTVARTPNG